jgi:hypothetical protein
VELDTQIRWWESDKAGLPDRLTSVMRTIHQRHGYRHQGLLKAARMFGNMPMLGLSPRGFSSPSTLTFGPLSINIVKALSTTVRADLVSGPAPRPWFLTTDGDFDAQRKAERLTKFAAGAMYQTGFDATARRVALHSAVFGDGLVKIYALNDKPIIELVFPWEVHVEEADGFYGAPRSMYQTKWIDRSVLKKRYPKRAREIDIARGVEIDPGGSLLSLQRDPLADQVLVIEAWHLPSAEGAGDGRHAIVIEGALLFEEEWEEETFPFVRFSWSEPLAGFWSQGIAGEVEGLQWEINLTIEKIRQALAICAVPRVMVEKGSKVTASQLNNDVGAIIYYVGKKPDFEVARAVSPELVQHLERLWSKAFQLTGVSELAASALKPAGLDSGRALRVYADMQSKRFVNWSVAFQDFYLEVSRQLIRLMRRLAADNPELDVVYRDPKRPHGERIQWAEVQLDEESYIMQAYPVSSLPSTPAGKLAAVDDMFNSGWIDAATARRKSGDPDLEAEFSLQDAPRDLLEQIMDRMLGEGQYIAPEPFFDLALAMKIGGLHYQKAVLQGVPEKRLELLRRFLVATQKLMQPPAPPPGAAPPMPGPPAGPMPPEMAAPPAPMPPGMAA